MSELKIPDFIQRLLDELDPTEEQFKEFVRLVKNYEIEKDRFKNNYGAQSANVHEKKVDYSTVLSRITEDYKKKALQLAKKHGLKENIVARESEKKENQSREQKLAEFKNNFNEEKKASLDIKKSEADDEKRAKFIEEMRAAKERDRIKEQERNR